MEIEITSYAHKISNEFFISIFYRINIVMCKISIIMPVYNKEKYVAKAIESVLNQTMEDWELLIIDDGSNDSSYEVCSRYKDSRIKVIHVNNGGVSRARNIGLEIATGEYITFVDGDDQIDSVYLEKLIIDDAEMVISGLIRKNILGQTVNEVLPFFEGKILSVEFIRTFYQHELENGIYGFVAGKVVKRSIIEDNRIRFDESMSLAEDYDFFLKVYQCITEIFFVRESFYYYYDSNERYFNIDVKEIPSQIELQIKTRTFLEKNEVFFEDVKKIMGEKIGGLIYTYLITCDSSQYSKFEKSIKKIRDINLNLDYNVMSAYGNLALYFFKRKRNYILYFLVKIHKKIRK